MQLLWTRICCWKANSLPEPKLALTMACSRPSQSRNCNRCEAFSWECTAWLNWVAEARDTSLKLFAHFALQDLSRWRLKATPQWTSVDHCWSSHYYAHDSRVLLGREYMSFDIAFRPESDCVLSCLSRLLSGSVNILRSRKGVLWRSIKAGSQDTQHFGSTPTTPNPGAKWA